MRRHLENLHRHGMHGSICLFEQVHGSGFFQVKKFETGTGVSGLDAVVPLVGLYAGHRDALREFSKTHGVVAKEVTSTEAWTFFVIEIGSESETIQRTLPDLLDVLNLPARTRFKLGHSSLHVAGMYTDAQRRNAARVERYQI
ncbi:hypothetical protein [Tateyamaria sp. SN3-11]|uniref:hypothetical protein n=1 Tax=Tateyamaria sp. SN3-11 TaxID=3092147 RepID=UPI0039E9C10B